LPVPNLTIIKDKREVDGKCTGVHAKILAPSQVSIVDSDCVGLLDLAECVVLFPDSNAVSPSTVDWTRVKNILVIEGTWNQAKAINSVIRASVQRITLPLEKKTVFWRYQQLGEHCLSTIEAIHCLMSLLLTHDHDGKSESVDDLLWFFSFQYHLIQDYYGKQEGGIRSFTRRHRPGYIKTGNTAEMDSNEET
jgi:ribosome biogenesis protein Tsr3